MEQDIIIVIAIAFVIRTLGIIESIGFWIRGKKIRFIYFILGWACWTLEGLVTPIRMNQNNNGIFQFLDVGSELLISLGALLIAVGIGSYMFNIKVKMVLISSLILIIIPSFFLFINMYFLAKSFSTLTLLVLAPSLLLMGILNRNKLQDVVGYNIIWFYVAIGFSVIYGLVYILVGSNPDFATVEFLFSTLLTIFLLILLIHFEQGVVEKDKFWLKDKYSHDLGNILQMIRGSASLIEKTPASEKKDIIEFLSLVEEKWIEASRLLNEIRGL